MGGENSLGAIPVKHGVELPNRLIAIGRGKFSAQRHIVSFAGEAFCESFNPQAIREAHDKEMDRRRPGAAGVH